MSMRPRRARLLQLNPSLEIRPGPPRMVLTLKLQPRIAAHQRAVGAQNPRDEEALRLLVEARRSWTSTEI